MAALRDLITKLTQVQYFTDLMARHRANKVPVGSWITPRNTGLSLTQIAALLFSGLRGSIADAIAALFLDYATGTGLTLFARSQYQLERQVATFTEGVMTLTAQVGAPGQTFGAGDVTVGTAGAASPNTRLFTNTIAGTLGRRRLTVAGTNGFYIEPKLSNVNFSVVVSGVNTPLAVNATLGFPGGAVEVVAATDADGRATSTAFQITTAISLNATAQSLLSITVDGTGAQVIGAIPVTSLERGTLILPFSATEPGAKHNIPPGSPLDMKTSFPGITVTNPAWISGTWITAQGVEEEGDDPLKLRCSARWGALGIAANEDGYKFWTLAIPNGYGASPVTQVLVLSDWKDGVLTPGYVTVVVAGPAGALSNTDVAAVQQNFEQPIASLASAAVPGLDKLTKKYPIGSAVEVKSAANLTVNLVGTISVYRRAGVSLAEVQTAVTAELTRYQRTLLIGQTLYPQRKIAGVIESAPPFGDAIARVDLGGMAATITPTLLQYPLLNAAGLVYQLVDV